MNTKNNETSVIVPKKRGRKSKKELEDIALQKMKDNINISIQETQDNVVITSNSSSLELDGDCDSILTNKPTPKKRGRKPKGGKIVQQIVHNNNDKNVRANVILHLKCCLADLETNKTQNNYIQSYNFQPTNQLIYDNINTKKEPLNNYEENYCAEDDVPIKENDNKEVWKKLKVLQHNLHVNNISDKKSACFWCTYDFDTPPVYIPKHFIKDSYHVYGCFCSPECGTAYLMEEKIDSSAKFERYHLMNHLYSKIYDYNKNIKPAPNPYYMLEKYYGNLSIQEYRALLRNERLFLVVDKPLTRILPELHEDNDDFIINNKIIPSNNYKIKKKSQKNQTKNNILSEKFGLTQC